MFKTKNCFITTIDFDDTKFYATEQDVLAAKYLTPITERFRTHSTLTTLYMSKSSLSNGTHLKSLEIAAKEGLLNNLEDIHLSKALTDDPLKNGAILITLLPSMATYCFRLKYFDISDNKLDVTAAQALGKAFVQFTTGKKDFELDLSTTCLNSISTRAFCSSVMATTLQTKLPRRIQPSNIEINFSHNPLGHYGLSAIFQMLNSDSCLVTNLTLNDIAEVERSNDTIKEIHMEEVTTSRGASKLTCFSFDGNKAFEEGLHIECLEVASKQGAFVLLQELNLSNTLSDCATLNGVLLSKFVVSIASECPYLMKLDLSNNRLNSRTGAQALGQTLPILCNAGKDFTLNLSDCHLNTDSIKTFSESAIVAFSSTTQPQLNIPLEVSLDLSKNPIQCKGLVHILDIIICKSCSITSLDLSKTVTVEFPTPDLYKPDSEINCVNLQLKKLDFSENSFSESKLFILVEYMQVCRFLNKLNCCSCSLSTHEIITILERLRVSNIKLESLQEWDVSDCNIDDEGVHALLEYSQDLFPHLESIDLDNNLVSAVVYSKLKKKLEEHSKQGKRSTVKCITLQREAVLAEWKKTQSLPKSAEMLAEFLHMWDKLLMSLIDITLEQQSDESDDSIRWKRDFDVRSNTYDDYSSESISAEELNLTLKQEQPTENDNRSPVKLPTSSDKDIPDISLGLLDKELKTLTSPKQFAVSLNIPSHIIKTIILNCPDDIEGQKIELFDFMV